MWKTPGLQSVIRKPECAAFSPADVLLSPMPSLKCQVRKYFQNLRQASSQPNLLSPTPISMMLAACFHSISPHLALRRLRLMIARYAFIYFYSKMSANPSDIRMSLWDFDTISKHFCDEPKTHLPTGTDVSTANPIGARI